MSHVSSALGGRLTTKSIKNAFSTNGYTSASVSSQQLGITVNSGALTANSLATVFSATNTAVTMPILIIGTVDATPRTLRIVVEVDGVSVFDSTSATISASGSGACLAGTRSSSVTATLPPINSKSSLIVKVASNLTETDKFFIHYAYQELI